MWTGAGQGRAGHAASSLNNHTTLKQPTQRNKPKSTATLRWIRCRSQRQSSTSVRNRFDCLLRVILELCSSLSCRFRCSGAGRGGAGRSVTLHLCTATSHNHLATRGIRGRARANKDQSKLCQAKPSQAKPSHKPYSRTPYIQTIQKTQNQPGEERARAENRFTSQRHPGKVNSLRMTRGF